MFFYYDATNRMHIYVWYNIYASFIPSPHPAPLCQCRYTAVGKYNTHGFHYK